MVTENRSVAVRKPGGGGERMIAKGHQEPSRSNGCIHCLDCVRTSQLNTATKIIKLDTLNMRLLFSINL